MGHRHAGSIIGFNNLLAPLQAIYLLTTGAREAAFRNIKTIAECLADELINAAKGSSNRCCMFRRTWHVRTQGLLGSADTKFGLSWAVTPLCVHCCSYAIKKKDELERVAKVSADVVLFRLPTLCFQSCSGPCPKDVWRCAIDTAARC